MTTARAAALLVAIAAGCAASPPRTGVEPCAGTRVQGDEALRQLRGCRRLRGDLVVEGAVTTLAPLAELAAVDGDLIVGPTLELSSASGLERLERVGGDLCVASNPFLGGLFLPRLEHVGGDLHLAHNLSATTVSLHALEAVGGSLTLVASRQVRRVDLSALGEVGGDARLVGMSGLEALAVGPGLRVGGAASITGSPALEPPEVPPGWSLAGAGDGEKAAGRRCSAR